MTIGYAEQRGTLIYIYDQDGKQVTSVSAPGRWPEDGLKDYSASNIHVRKGTLMYTYDEHGHQTGKPYVVREQRAASPHAVGNAKNRAEFFICP